jgi:SAM-dependent methyltransferase
MDRNRELRARNARRWGHIREGHLSRWYDVEAFRAGGSSLRPLEVEALGDVTGRRLLHLQCNCGLDTLSWARRGAVATGVDLSEACIDYARNLAREVDLDARFLCCDVLDLNEALPETFDIVIASYGVLCWIDDLERWMAVAAHHLEPGGLLFYVSGHPAVWPFDEAGEVEASYFHTEAPFVSEPEDDRDLPTYEWQWTVADIVNAAVGAGLRIERLGEYPFAAYRCLERLVRDEEGWWRLPGTPYMPLMLSLKARRPGPGDP